MDSCQAFYCTNGKEIFNEGGIKNNFTFECSSNNNIFSFVAMSADSIPSSKTNIFQNKLIYCRRIFQNPMGAIVIRTRHSSQLRLIPYLHHIEEAKRTHPRFADWRTRYDEGTESVEVATSGYNISALIRCNFIIKNYVTYFMRTHAFFFVVANAIVLSRVFRGHWSMCWQG
jgi:hypothetical protein